MPENWQTAGFGLYLHWPFCEAKCPYCDFNSHVARHIDQDAWCAAYVEELDRSAQETSGRLLQSVFFGGGTPSLMEPRIVDTILQRIDANWQLANDMEITLEANPSSVEAARFEYLAKAGVNRVSLGVQALNNDDLKKLGRLHSVEESLTAIETAQNSFDRVSVDLMYGRQDQTFEAWKSELNSVLAMGLSHLSLYQLTIEPGTAFGERHAGGKLPGLPDEDLGADLYELTQDLCSKAGIPAYEVSNHARPGEESRHNLIYWRSGDYVGIGPGAHGRLTLDGTRFATEHTRAPKPWLEGQRELPRSVLDRESQSEEMLLMGLRLTEGLDLKRHASPGVPLKTVEELVGEGWLRLDGDFLFVEPHARPLLNAILVRLAA